LPARGRPPQAAARRAGLEVVEKLLTSITSGSGLEVVEKLLTSITSGSGLAVGQATSRSSWNLLDLAADVRDQGLAQLVFGELVVQARDGKPLFLS
jgi:hypothetical protein